MIQQKRRLSETSMVLNEKYILSSLIGKGSFGEVYKGDLNLNYREIQQQSNKKYPKTVAIKVENDPLKSQIANQIVVIKKVASNKNENMGFPHVFGSGVESGNSYMIMQLLGPNLYDLMMLCGGHFSLKTSLLLTLQILERIELLHQMGFIYRDIKPQNFVMGIGKNSNKVYIVDFGLCKKCEDQNTKLKLPYKQNVSMVGTIRYSSLNSHLGIDQTRRDDIQSVFYLLIYFIRGELPWQKTQTENKVEKDHQIMDMKLKITPEQLCENLPQELCSIFQYIKSLDFYKEIDYKYLIVELNYVLQSHCKFQSFSYDWQSFEKDTTFKKTNVEIHVNQMQSSSSEQGSVISKENRIKPRGYRESGFKN